MDWDAVFIKVILPDHLVRRERLSRDCSKDDAFLANQEH
jgi:hypothetical protein